MAVQSRAMRPGPRRPAPASCPPAGPWLPYGGGRPGGRPGAAGGSATGWNCASLPQRHPAPRGHVGPAEQTIPAARGPGRVQHPRVGPEPGRHHDRDGVPVLPWRQPRRDPAGLVHVAAPARHVTAHASIITGGHVLPTARSRASTSRTGRRVPPMALGSTATGLLSLHPTQCLPLLGEVVASQVSGLFLLPGQSWDNPGTR